MHLWGCCAGDAATSQCCVEWQGFHALNAHLAEAEDIAVVDVVRLVLSVWVGSQEDLAVCQQVGIRASPQSIVARLTAWEPVLGACSPSAAVADATWRIPSQALPIWHVSRQRYHTSPTWLLAHSCRAGR